METFPRCIKSLQGLFYHLLHFKTAIMVIIVDTLLLARNNFYQIIISIWGLSSAFMGTLKRLIVDCFLIDQCYFEFDIFSLKEQCLMDYSLDPYDYLIIIAFIVVILFIIHRLNTYIISKNIHYFIFVLFNFESINS